MAFLQLIVDWGGGKLSQNNKGITGINLVDWCDYEMWTEQGYRIEIQWIMSALSVKRDILALNSITVIQSSVIFQIITSF